MNIEQHIQTRLKTKPICLMTHVIAGYPSFDANLKALEIMAENDVDLVEIQMPFSEPTADGPVFAKANQESLDRGTNLEQYFDLMRQATQKYDFPILMMGYYNMVFKMGEKSFLDRLQAAGGSGFIVPDLPVEEADSLYSEAKKRGLSPISFMTPTTPDDRLHVLGHAGSGFIYVVARAGVTGKHTLFSQDFEDYLKKCHAATNLPLAVGFGISEKSDLDFLTGKAEVAIIGTALLKAWKSGGEQALRAFFAALK